MSLHPKTVLISERILACPVFIFGVNAGHLGNPEVELQSPVRPHRKSVTTHKIQPPTIKRRTDSQKSRRHETKCMLSAITMASENQKVASQAFSRAFYLSTRALVILDPRPDRDARGPRQWPFHSARPGPKGPARVRGVQPRGATSLFRNPA